MHWIYKAVTIEIFKEIIGSKLAKEAFDRLEKSYWKEAEEENVCLENPQENKSYTEKNMVDDLSIKTDLIVDIDNLDNACNFVLV